MDFPQEDFGHPERSYKGLIWAPGGILPESFRKDREGLDITTTGPDSQAEEYELCWVCGWTNFNQYCSTYASRVRCLKTRHNSGMWALGSKYLLKDIPNNSYSPGNDYITQKFLHSQPGLSIPLVDRIELLSQPTDKTYLLLMSRAEGQSLDKVWDSLSEEKRSNIREQLLIYLRELGQFTAPNAQTVDGGQLNDRIIGECSTMPSCKRMGSTTEEWFENIAEELRAGISKIHKTKDSARIELELQKMKDNFPNPEPYVFTHGDLTYGNIMVKDDKITAIIDWEYAGYHPWWVECWIHCNRAHDGSYDLLMPIWGRLSPRFEGQSFRKEVTAKLRPVLEAWNASPISQKRNLDAWYRPPFAESEPWAGRFHVGGMGEEKRVPHYIEPGQ